MTRLAFDKPARRSQNERSADTRRKVVEAAVRSLAERGYSATTTTTVAAEAGVTRGAMFHQYPTKVDLMIDIVTLNYEEERQLYHERLDHIRDIKERFFTLPTVMWELGKRPAGIAVLEIMNGSRSDPELARRLGPTVNSADLDALQNLETVLIEAGHPEMTPDLALTRLVMASIRGLVIERVFSAHPEELDECVVRLKSMIEIYYDQKLIELSASPLRKSESSTA